MASCTSWFCVIFLDGGGRAFGAGVRWTGPPNWTGALRVVMDGWRMSERNVCCKSRFVIILDFVEYVRMGRYGLSAGTLHFCEAVYHVAMK